MASLARAGDVRLSLKFVSYETSTPRSEAMRTASNTVSPQLSDTAWSIPLTCSTLAFPM